jgi:putative ABC transport system substrate-binding protein
MTSSYCLTGVTILADDLDGKRQEILIEAVPGIRGMAALCDPKTTTDAQLHALQEAAHARNIELSIHRIVSAEDVAAAIDIAKTWAPRRLTFWRHRSFGPFVS